MQAPPSPCLQPGDFEDVVDRQHAVVYRYAYRLTGCAASAEDICQEVFLKAFRNLHQLRDAGAERAWMLAITRNEFGKWLRHNAGRFTGENVDDFARPDSGDSPESRLENSDWVNSALAKLPNEFRIVVLMFYFEDLSYSEIAERLSIPIGTVMSRLSRGRNRLKQCLLACAATS